MRAGLVASLYATLVGIEAPPNARTIEIKPYAVGNLGADRVARATADGDVGVDLKYGVTQNLTADATYNTDFAQVEADEQQVNLTRFSLFFPEKREFFLENQGTYAFAGLGGTQGNAASGGGDAPTLFYSRRIGLDQMRVVPLRAGGRLTGRLGRFSVGLLNVQTGNARDVGIRATNFGVVRVKRDILRRSSIGAMLTTRSVAQSQIGGNQAYGVDGTFAFFENLSMNTYWAKTHTETLEGDDVSYRGHIEYAGDRYGAQLEHLAIGAQFNPEIGFVRRRDMRQHYGQLRFSPRPRSIRSIRKFISIASITHIEDRAGRLETRELDGEFAIELQNSDRFHVGVLDSFERLKEPFAIAAGVTIPAGAFEFTTARVGYSFGQQRPFSGLLAAEHGTFYGGERSTLAFSRARVNLSSQFSLEPNVSLNWVSIPGGSFTSTLVGSRVTFTVTPLMFVSALVQFNSSNHRATANVRLRWEYRPGSELFVVYNEERDTLTPRFPAFDNRALIVKINRLFRL
jgi:hypothetical protein